MTVSGREEEPSMTLVFLLFCSEPITEEGDGETEHLPSEDGQYAQAPTLSHYCTVTPQRYIITLLCVSAGVYRMGGGGYV